ncbi:MAG: hypothetical protein VKP62_14385 [Candidatus Sericytochromatia bacterium]|nr:hypothetical protein [Candidatus Sericytochromatia bacterium]
MLVSPSLPGTPAAGPAPATVASASPGLPLAEMAQLVPGTVAGLQSGRAWQKALSAARRRSRPRYAGDYGGYGGSYDRYGQFRSSYSRRGGAEVGMGASSRVLGRLGNAIRSSALWGTGLSLGLNLWALAERRITGAQAGVNVVGDAMASVVGGTTGALASAAGTAMLGGLLGTGLPMVLAAAALGIGGYLLGDAWLRQTRFFQDVQLAVWRMLGGA